MERLLTSIEKNTRHLPQIPIFVNFKKKIHTENLIDTIDLSDGNYTMSLRSFITYYSIDNVNNKNNKIVYSDDSLVWEEIVLPNGLYEITQINDEIVRQLSLNLGFTDPTESPIILEPNEATGHSIIKLADGYKIDFTQNNTLRDLLGFESKILTNSYNHSKNKVNITSINRINVCCDCINGFLKNGSASNILASIVINEIPHAKIVREPSQPLYVHVYKEKLDYIDFWLEDDYGNIIDNNGEPISMIIHLKQNS